AQLSTRRGLRRLRRAVPAEPAEPSAFKLGGGLGPAEEEAVEQVARPLIGIRRSSQPVQYASWDEGRSQVAAYLARLYGAVARSRLQSGERRRAQLRIYAINAMEASPPPPLPQLPTMLPAIRGTLQ
ncbi:unnamed protein product, partial [Effrenium voratum]